MSDEKEGNLADIFNVESKIEEIKEKRIEVTKLRKTSSIDEDAEFAKSNIRDAIDLGKDALEEMLMITKQSQHPRSFEAFTQLMKEFVLANKELMETNKLQKEIGEEKAPETVNNNVFVGTTADLARMLEEKGKRDE